MRRMANTMIPAMCISFLAFTPLVEGHFHNPYSSNTYESKLNEVKSAVNSFQSDFERTEKGFHDDLKNVMDEIQQITDDMLARWEQEDYDLANICSYPSTACKTETIRIEEARLIEIEAASTELPEKKVAVVDKYIEELLALRVRALQVRSSIEESKRYFLYQRQYSYANEVEKQSQIFEEVVSAVDAMITSLHHLVFGNLCFEFNSESQPLEPLEPSQYHEFDEAMRKSLEIAFMRNKVDFNFVALKLIGQEYTEQRRMLRSGISSTSKMDNEERNLGQRGLRLATEVAGMCTQCNTDVLQSDVIRLRKLEGDRELFGSKILETLSQVLAVELSNIFAHLTSVKSFHCSHFNGDVIMIHDYSNVQDPDPVPASEPTGPAPSPASSSEDCVAIKQPDANPWWAGLQVGFDSAKAQLDFSGTGLDLSLISIVSDQFTVSVSGQIITLEGKAVWVSKEATGHMSLHGSDIAALGTFSPPKCTEV